MQYLNLDHTLIEYEVDPTDLNDHGRLTIELEQMSSVRAERINNTLVKANMNIKFTLDGKQYIGLVMGMCDEIVDNGYADIKTEFTVYILT